MNEYGYSFVEAANLPMKRLAVHSGLAKYGRNNVTYIDGLGSNFSYYAYFSDINCEDDTWGEIKNMGICDSCRSCVENCPTGAILKDRFLIDNQKCLSCINEVKDEFPSWVPITAHHTLYDCLICQRVCPMNVKQINNFIEGISFSEEETGMLLEGKPIDTFSDDVRSKIYKLGINDWYDAIPRNLETLFQQDALI
jgi:epoxyqueuosine reductase